MSIQHSMFVKKELSQAKQVCTAGKNLMLFNLYKILVRGFSTPTKHSRELPLVLSFVMFSNLPAFYR